VIANSSAPIRTLIHRSIVAVAPDATLRMIAETLVDESVGVAVVSNVHEQRRIAVAGLVSERDLSQALAEGLDPDRRTAEDVMTIDLAYGDAQEPVKAAARRMIDNEIRHLVVTDHDAPIGVISARDVLEALLASEQELQ
jgi:predicted transcriptional regulator